MDFILQGTGRAAMASLQIEECNITLIREHIELTRLALDSRFSYVKSFFRPLVGALEVHLCKYATSVVESLLAVVPRN